MSIFFSPVELFNVAIVAEKNGRDFYAKAEELAADDRAKLLFRYLKEQEIKHIADFTTLYNMSKPQLPLEPLSEPSAEFEDYSEAFVDFEFVNEFTRDKDKILATRDIKTIIDFAMQFEEETIEFYEHLRELVSGRAMELLENIITEENNHILRLQETQHLFTS